jgi:hypothetical protein
VKLQRKRLIAIAAGAITIVAIVLSFGSGYLGLGWQWLRPAGELPQLAELIGLILLGRINCSRLLGCSRLKARRLGGCLST